MSDELWPCPICGQHNRVHVDGVVVANAHQSVTVDTAGEDENAMVFTRLGPAPEEKMGRRHDVSLVGWCEIGGHRFTVTFRQHKGDTLLSTAVVPGSGPGST